MGRGANNDTVTAVPRYSDPIEALSSSWLSAQGRTYNVPKQPLVEQLAQDLGVAVGPPLTAGMPFSIQSQGAAIGLTILEDEHEVRLQAIDAVPKNSGLGSQVVVGLRDYCQRNNKDLRVVMVTNRAFFGRFGFLRDDYGDLVYRQSSG